MSLSLSEAVLTRGGATIPANRTAAASVAGRSNRLALLSGLHFLNDGLQSALLLALPFIAAELGLTQVEVGGVASLHLLAGALLSAPLSLAAGRFEGRSLLVAVVGWGAGCFALTALTSGFGFLLATGLVAGVGFGVFHPVAFGMVARGSRREDASRSMGLFTAAGDLGRIATAAAILALLPLFGWRTVLLTVGLPIAFGSVLLLPLLGRRGEKAVLKDRGAPRLVSVRSFRASQRFWLLCAIGFVDGLANSSLSIFLPFLLIAKGMTPARLAMLMPAFFVAGLCGRVVVGWLGDRCGRSRQLTVCQAAIGLSVAGLCLSQSFAAATLFVVLLGVFNRGTLPILMSRTAEHLSSETVEFGFAVNQAVLGVAASLSPLLLGAISARTGITGAFAGAAALCGLNALFTIAARDAA